MHYVYLRKLHIRRTGYYHSYSYALIDIIQALLHEHHHQAIQVRLPSQKEKEKSKSFRSLNKPIPQFTHPCPHRRIASNFIQGRNSPLLILITPETNYSPV